MTNTDTSEHEWSSQKIINVAPNLYDFLFFGTHNEKFQICACCEEKTSCRFEIAWGWVTNKRAIIIGCTVPLSTVYCIDLKLETLGMFAVVVAVALRALLYLSVSAWLQEKKTPVITHRQKQHAVHPEGGVTGVERQPGTTQSTEEGRIGQIQDNDTRRREKESFRMTHLWALFHRCYKCIAYS